MAILKSKREQPGVEVSVQAESDYDVLTLRRLTDHPALRPMMERRQEICARLEACERERAAQKARVADLQHLAARGVAEHGPDWQPSALRDAEQALADLAAQEELLQAGLHALDEDIERSSYEARIAVEGELNRLRRPHVAKITEALQGIVEHNAALHAIEAKSQRLLGTGRWHLYDAGLSGRLNLVQRTLHLLDLGETAEEG
jgi:hypothetical protein